MTKGDVVFVVSGDLWGGAESMAVRLLGGLRALGLKTRALTFNEGLTAARLRATGVETHVVDERQSLPVMIMQARRCLLSKPVGLIHAHGYKENFLAAALAPLLQQPPLVSTVHGLSETADARPATPRRRLIHGLNSWLLAHRFSATVAVSDFVRHALVNTFGLPAAKVRLIFNGIPVPHLNGQPAPRRITIGSAGRLYAVKNFPLMLEVAAIVCARRPEVRFVILGEGPERPRLEELIRHRGLENSVELPGFVAEATPVLRSLSLYLNTSHHEGMPLAVLEAMACGLPVVAPRVGGFPEMIEDGVEGLLAPPGDAAGLAECCLRLIEDPLLRHRMGEAARRKVGQRFSVESMTQGYLRLYSELAA